MYWNKHVLGVQGTTQSATRLREQPSLSFREGTAWAIERHRNEKPRSRKPLQFLCQLVKCFLQEDILRVQCDLNLVDQETAAALMKLEMPMDSDWATSSSENIEV